MRDFHQIASMLAAQGRGNDTVLAHITPGEAALLKSLGGRGTTNPKTGLLELDWGDGSMSGYQGDGPTADPGAGNQGSSNDFTNGLPGEPAPSGTPTNNAAQGAVNPGLASGGGPTGVGTGNAPGGDMFGPGNPNGQPTPAGGYNAGNNFGFAPGEQLGLSFWEQARQGGLLNALAGIPSRTGYALENAFTWSNIASGLLNLGIAIAAPAAAGVALGAKAAGLVSTGLSLNSFANMIGLSSLDPGKAIVNATGLQAPEGPQRGWASVLAGPAAPNFGFAKDSPLVASVSAPQFSPGSVVYDSVTADTSLPSNDAAPVVVQAGGSAPSGLAAPTLTSGLVPVSLPGVTGQEALPDEQMSSPFSQVTRRFGSYLAA